MEIRVLDFVQPVRLDGSLTVQFTAALNPPLELRPSSLYSVQLVPISLPTQGRGGVWASSSIADSGQGNIVALLSGLPESPQVPLRGQLGSLSTFPLTVNWSKGPVPAPALTHIRLAAIFRKYNNGGTA